MRMRAPRGLLVTTLAFGCFEEDDPLTTTPGMDETTAPTTTGPTSVSETDPTAASTDGATDDPTVGVTTMATESADTSSSGEPPVGVCEDGEVTPGELCLGDIAVIMANDSVVSVRVGNVSGSASADVVYLIPDQVVLRVGGGDGTFGTAIFDEPMTGQTFELADMDDDNQLDLIGLEQGGALRVLLGNGGGFAPADYDVAGMSAQAMALGDLDGNGTVDAVVGTDDAMLVPLLGSGDGELTLQPAINGFGSVHAIALADFTGDGDVDVATAITGGSVPGVGLRPGDGMGGLLDQQATPGRMTGAVDLAAGDFDGDGHPDVAYISGTLDSLGVLLNNGRGGFAGEQIYPVGMEPTVLVAEDLTGNGRDELVVIHDGEPSLHILVPGSDGTMVPEAPIMLAAIATDLDTGDINDDGAPDIAAASSAQAIVTILLSTP